MNIVVGAEVELIIQGIGTGGEGVGDYQGLKIFVEGALPEEKILAKIIILKKNYALGKLVKILEVSQKRIDPICPIFGKCGGCQMMHLSYSGQLEIKKKKILDAFQRIAKSKITEPLEVVASPQILHYRNKIQLPAAWSQKKLCLGLYAKKSHQVIPTNKCFIHAEQGEFVFEKITELLQQSTLQPYDELSKTGELRHVLIRTAVISKEVLVVLITVKNPSVEIQHLAKEIKNIPGVKGVIHHKNGRDDNVILDQHFTLLQGLDRIEEVLEDKIFHVSAASFFQVNTPQALQLYRYAIECAEIDKTKTVLDAYCGVGTLSLLLAHQVKKVIGVEYVMQAIEDARENAKNNQITNAEFFCSATEDFIAKVKEVDVVILNPPRKGCEASVLSELSRLNPETIIYISCDPATLARDNAILESLGFKKDKIKGFDMFPQTMHVETVVRFRR
jgi:23S rRNA (uracil1939-C5)-methyltransferase